MEATPVSVPPEVANEWFRCILEGLEHGTLKVPEPDQRMLDLNSEQVRKNSFTKAAPVTTQKPRRPRHLRRERCVKKKKVRPDHPEDWLPDFDDRHAARVNARHPGTF